MSNHTVYGCNCK